MESEGLAKNFVDMTALTTRLLAGAPFRDLGSHSDSAGDSNPGRDQGMRGPHSMGLKAASSPSSIV